jgi:hypothetical protein
LLLNGELYAREVSRAVAETFVKHPHAYTNAFIDVERLRAMNLEKWDGEAVKFLKSRGTKV